MVNNICLSKRKRTPSSPPTPGFDRNDTGRPMLKRHNPGDEDEDKEASTAAGCEYEDETMRSDSSNDERPAFTGEQCKDEESLRRAREDHYEGTSAPTPEYCAEEAGIEDHFEEHPEDAELPEYIQRGSVWFEDGNFVLRAGGTAFRVHTSVLSRQSEVFKDIFSHADELDEIDGCPVAVREDDPRDLVMLLETMYGFISLTPGQLISFETVSACLRLGTSYQVETIRQAAREILRSCYPSTLQELDRADLEPQYTLIGTDMLDFEAALLAHGQGLNHILVMALYRCCSIKPWEFMDRLGLDEGPGEHTPEPAMPYGKTILRKYLCGRADLVRLCATYSLGFLDGAPSNTCQSSEICRRELECLVIEAHRARLLFDNACALQCQDDFIDEATNKMDVCISCYKYLKTRHQEGREKVLAMLPDIFRVWGEAQI